MAVENWSRKIVIAGGIDKDPFMSKQGAAPLVQTYEILKYVGRSFGHHRVLVTNGGDLRLLDETSLMRIG